MNYQFTSRHLTLGGIERPKQGNLVFIGLCIIDKCQEGICFDIAQNLASRMLY